MLHQPVRSVNARLPTGQLRMKQQTYPKRSHLYAPRAPLAREDVWLDAAPPVLLLARRCETYHRTTSPWASSSPGWSYNDASSVNETQASRRTIIPATSSPAASPTPGPSQPRIESAQSNQVTPDMFNMLCEQITLLADVQSRERLKSDRQNRDNVQALKTAISQISRPL